MGNPVYQLPGLGAFLGAQDANQQRGLQQLQQAQLLMGLRGAMEKQQQEQAYRSEVAQLGPNATTEQLAGVVSKYNPGKALDIRQRSEDKLSALAASKAQFEERQATRKQYDDMMHEYRMTNAANQAARDAETARRNKVLEEMQAEQRKFEREFKVMQLEAQGRTREAAEERRKDQDIEKQILKVTSTMKDVQPVLSIGHQLNDILSRYTPENVPGIGYAKNTDIGKAFLTQEGKDVASSQKLLGSAILKAMSGTAVTASEEVRQMAAQMADGRFSAKDFYIAWPKISAWINDQAKLGLAPLTDDGRTRFVERTKLNIDPIKPRFTFDGKQLQDSYGSGSSDVDKLLDKYKDQ